MLAEPVESLVESVSSDCAGSLDVPGLASDGVEAELVSDFWGGHGSWKILLVGVNEDDSVLEFLIIDHFVELLSSVIDSVSVVGVDDEDDALGVGVVVSPQLSDLVLTAHIPNVERDVLVADLFYIESNGWDWGNDLTELQLVEDGGLTGGIEADHQNSHFDIAEHPLPDAGKHASHCLLILIFITRI